ELYDEPVNVFVGGFIGSPAMNQLEVKAEDGGVRMGSATVPLPSALAQAARDHERMILGVRPEHLHLGGEGKLEVQVDLVEDLGSDSFAHGHLAGEPGQRIIVRGGREHPRRGATVKAAIDTEHLHLFDAESGARIVPAP
ncbi:MAG: TOBE domain-containing protein, partial [Acidimicrobiales bacterium]